MKAGVVKEQRVELSQFSLDESEQFGYILNRLYYVFGFSVMFYFWNRQKGAAFSR
jgi:hypothetical protein